MLFENLFILRIILGYGNDKLRDYALSISYLRRHPYVLLPYCKNNNNALYLTILSEKIQW